MLEEFRRGMDVREGVWIFISNAYISLNWFSWGMKLTSNTGCSRVRVVEVELGLHSYLADLPHLSLTSFPIQLNFLRY